MIVEFYDAFTALTGEYFSSAKYCWGNFIPLISSEVTLKRSDGSLMTLTPDVKNALLQSDSPVIESAKRTPVQCAALGFSLDRTTGTIHVTIVHTAGADEFNYAFIAMSFVQNAYVFRKTDGAYAKSEEASKSTYAFRPLSLASVTNATFAETLEWLTKNVPSSPIVSAEAYCFEKSISKTSLEVVLARRDYAKISLNCKVSDVIQSNLPAEFDKQLYYACDALGFTLDKVTGVVHVTVYILGLAGTKCSFIDVLFFDNGKVTCHKATERYETQKESKVVASDAHAVGGLNARVSPTGEWVLTQHHPQLSSPSSSSETTTHVSRPEPALPVCRIEAPLLGYESILDGKEDVDWRMEKSEDYDDCVLFWTCDKDSHLVLKQDFSAAHPDLKIGFKFNHLMIVNHSVLELHAGDGRDGETFRLKLKAYELVAD